MCFYEFIIWHLKANIFKSPKQYFMYTLQFLNQYFNLSFQKRSLIRCQLLTMCSRRLSRSGKYVKIRRIQMISKDVVSVVPRTLCLKSREKIFFPCSQVPDTLQFDITVLTVWLSKNSWKEHYFKLWNSKTTKPHYLLDKFCLVSA